MTHSVRHHWVSNIDGSGIDVFSACHSEALNKIHIFAEEFYCMKLSKDEFEWYPSLDLGVISANAIIYDKWSC